MTPEPVEIDLTGRTLGRYEILAKLGAGGMGEVYRARDTRLKREVALKVLPSKWTRDIDRKRRFEQEARAASALNHSNIVTIYDIDEIEGVNVIAMEYVTGKALDHLIPRQGLPLQHALKYGIEIAAALAAAHAAGIVHRDLKPSNVMVSDTGQVKVLDFGLAKLTEQVTAGEDEPTVTLRPETEEGAIIGTVSYMSPEQAEGKPVDARSDIFSFGSMLYEMVTGQRAFRGATKISTLAAIVEHEPPPLDAVAPQELVRVITRCLRKEAARRFQHMGDVQIALEELKDESTLPAGSGPATRRIRGNWLWTAAAATAVTLAGVFWWYGGAGKPLPPMEIVPFTTDPGPESYPSFSPDGNQVVYNWWGEKRDNFDIYLKMIGVPTPKRLTTDPAADTNPVFSPDGRSIGFVRNPGDRLMFVTMPSIGGPPETVVAEILSPWRDKVNWWDDTPGTLWGWFPDGKHIVTDGLTLVSVDTGEQSSLTNPQPSLGPDFSPTVSPDGRTIAFCRLSGSHMSELYRLDLDAGLKSKGDPRRLTSLKRHTHSPVWMPDGRKIIFVSGQGFVQELWSVPANGSSEPQPLPIKDASINLSISRAGNRLAYERILFTKHIWRFSLSRSGDAAGPPVQFIASTRFEDDPQYSPDGKRIAFDSDRSGARGIWVSDADGVNRVELFSQPGALSANPRWAPNGERLAFDSNAAGNRDIYVIRANGGKAVRLTSDAADDRDPSWSVDGKWVYFASNRSGRDEVWKVLADGGDAAQVTRSGGWRGYESGDGKSTLLPEGGRRANRRVEDAGRWGSGNRGAPGNNRQLLPGCRRRPVFRGPSGRRREGRDPISLLRDRQGQDGRQYATVAPRLLLE